MERRQFVASIGVVTTGAIAGCLNSGDGNGSDDGNASGSGETVHEVASGPEGRLRFDPETIEISVGDTVRWTAESPGHNVTSKPGASEKCENPDGAEPFASYEGDDHFAVMEEGSTFEHTFDVAGEYVYVCAPHEGQGMVGEITVTE